MSGGFSEWLDLPTSLAGVALILASQWGWGRTLLRALREREEESNLFNTLLCGWAVLVFLAQLVHLFLPLSGLTPLWILAPGLAVAVVKAFRRASGTIANEPVSWGAGLIVAAATVWATARAMASPTYYDAGLYYFGMIEWTQTFRVVPGLGNLHGRFAFNSSEFPYAALTTFSQWSPSARSLGNVAFLATSLGWLVTRIVRADRSGLRGDAVCALAVLPLLVRQAVQVDCLASPVPELITGALHLILLVMLAGVVLFGGRSLTGAEAATAALLCGTALTVKLSTIGYVASFGLLLGLHCLRSGQPMHRSARLLLLAAAPVLVWVVRGFVLSGYPAYPSQIGRVGFDWTVPAEQATEDANWIYSWARAPGKHWSEVLGNSDWVRPWLSNLIADRWMLRMSAAGILALIVSGAVCLRRGVSPGGRCWWLLLPVGSQLAFWFVTAPDPRFANHALELVGVVTLLIALDRWNAHEFRPAGRWAYASILLTLIPLALNVARHPEWISAVSVRGWQPVPAADVTRVGLSEDLTVLRPLQGDQCWCAPLPCAPLPPEGLMLRSPPDLGSGFRVERTRDNQ